MSLTAVSCTAPYKGRECIDLRTIVWDCQTYCETSKDLGVSDPMECKGGCWLLSEYAKPLLAEIVSKGLCTAPDYTTRCIDALDTALMECVAENREVISRDVGTGLFKFAEDLEDRCFKLSANEGSPGR